jgi:hypothetical protein
VQGIGGDYQSDPSAPVDVGAGRPGTVDLSLTAMRAPQLAAAWLGEVAGAAGGEAEGGGAAPALPEGDGKKIVKTKCPPSLLKKKSRKSAVACGKKHAGE